MRTNLLILLLSFSAALPAQHSVARLWNEQVLEAISGDLARPTVHARNLFHTSIAMYDAWSVYNLSSDTYLLGKTVNGHYSPYHRIPPPAPADIPRLQNEAISFAVYRILRHRFELSPGKATLFPAMDQLMKNLGYNILNTSKNYKCGPAEMGNYIAQCVIDYGLQDGANEEGDYTNRYYEPVNTPLFVESPGNPRITDLDRWQPLAFTQFIDQSGNPFSNFTPKFLSPEWGNVAPFALRPEDAVTYQRDGHPYNVYHDPGLPALIDTTQPTDLTDDYKWNFALVAIWAALLDPADPKLLDISPASIGNNTSFPDPADQTAMRSFYNLLEGGDPGTGRPVNPKTGLPYAPQIVKRADYTRVLAEFWADGPKSVTPPGHWFEILNYVSDQPELIKKIGGVGPLCDDLEWDVKSYFALGGAMHDAAISAWSIKGWYDGIRPVSAIRGMAERGQCSDPTAANYHPAGLPLVPGYIETVQVGDPLAGDFGENIGAIKLYTWRGPAFVNNPLTDVAGVGWILAKNWWPYQRPTFVTPPFAGYISGHSTFSRAAAELLTALTGDAYFPGGMGTFYCPRYEYLVFEDGPTTDITLQWATYRDASDQCSLSRIYGGIHPPMDDIPGRLIGITVGTTAMAFAEQYFRPSTLPDSTYSFRIFPNPTTCMIQLEMDYTGAMPLEVYHIDGRLVWTAELEFNGSQALLDLTPLQKGVYIIVGKNSAGDRIFQEKVVRL